MVKDTIVVSPWSGSACAQASQQHALFNGELMAKAVCIEQNEPFFISINGGVYLAYKRHASGVIAGLALADIQVLVSNPELVKLALLPMGIRRLSLNSCNAENDKERLATSLKLNCQIRFEFVIDTQYYAQNKISRNHRRNIQKCEKSGALAKLGTDLSAIRAHIALVNTNLADKGAAGISNSAEYFYFLMQHQAGLLLQVFDKKNLLASTFFIVNQAFAYYHSSGTNEAGKRIGAAHFLVARMIEKMQARQIRYLNLAGCTSQQTGLYRFKTGFKPCPRILLSANMSLINGWKQKLRALLKSRWRDILVWSSVQLFSKRVGMQPMQSGYCLSALSFMALVEHVLSYPQLCPSLVLLSQTNAECYGLYNEKGQFMGLGFIGLNDKCAAASASPERQLGHRQGEIKSLYVLKSLRTKGNGKILLALLEKQAAETGLNKLYASVDVANIVASKTFDALGFICKAEHKRVSTQLMGGKAVRLASFIVKR
jgi:ribosomal protein S18 acetylase RimI-like enzyme